MSIRLRLTPACAGKTGRRPNVYPVTEAHPRLRGEDSSVKVPKFMACGSPPLARGRLLPTDVCHLLSRLTPACAGKTETAGGRHRCSEAHPRLRGEDFAH